MDEPHSVTRVRSSGGAVRRLRRNGWILSCLPMVVACGGRRPGSPNGSAAASIAFTGVTVIDGTGGTPAAGMTVVVQGRRILAVGSSNAVPVPAGAHVVDARGKYLMPGLWDMHAHIAKAGAQSLPLFVAEGVTSVRDMGGDFAMVRALRDSIEAEQRIGPRIKTPGPIVEAAANVDRMLRERTIEPVARFRAPVATAADAERVSLFSARCARPACEVFRGPTLEWP